MPYRDDTGSSFWREIGGQREEPVPASRRIAPQHWRCPGCQKIIYSWDKTLPCDRHRVVSEWQHYYQSEQFVTDTAEARAAAASEKPRRDMRERAAQQG